VKKALISISMLYSLEEDRRAEVHGANVRREKYNEREKEIQVMPLKV
jgi:hypothetical protein